MQRHNRIRIVLAEKDLRNNFLAQRLDVNDATVSRWCSNTAQPRLPMLYRIADALEVDVRDLLLPNAGRPKSDQ